MQRVENSLGEFTAALRNGKAVNCTADGRWYCEGRFMRFVRWIFGLHDRRVANIARIFNQCLDQLESTPVKFDMDLFRSTVFQPIPDLKTRFDSFLLAAEVLSQKLSKFHSRRVKDKANLLDHRVIGLKLRSQYDMIKEPVSDTQIATYNELVRLGRMWKEGQEGYVNKEIEKKELCLLKTICGCTEFVELLKKSSSICYAFFSWTFRNKNDPSIFIQYPYNTKMMHMSFLSGRVGKFAEPLLRINLKEKDSMIKKDLRMLFEGRAISVLDETKEISLKNDDIWTINQVYEDFSKKHLRHCDLEVMEDGINNWNSYEMGAWNPSKNGYDRVDFQDREWWKKVPRFQTLSKDDVESYYNLKAPLEPNQWVGVPCSARQELGLDLDKSHAYFEILAPIEDGKYLLLPIGDFPVSFPATFGQKVRFLVNTLEGRKCYPDENPFLTKRQKAGLAFVLDSAQGEELMNVIARDFEKGLAGNAVFQWAFHNCGAQVQSTFENLLGRIENGGRVPNLFSTPVLDATPQGALGYAFRWMKKFPKKWHHGVLKIFCAILGDNRGKYVQEEGKRVFKSIRTSPFSNKKSDYYHKIFIPSSLNEGILNKKEGFERGFITMGHA